MKCPLLFMAWKPETSIKQWDLKDCLKEECAWWNKFENDCAVLGIARELIVVKATLYEIASKMPHPSF